MAVILTMEKASLLRQAMEVIVDGAKPVKVYSEGEGSRSGFVPPRDTAISRLGSLVLEISVCCCCSRRFCCFFTSFCESVLFEPQEAPEMAQPSLIREEFSPIPDVKWVDIGVLDLLKHEFDLHILRRIKCPEAKDYEGLGMNLETGFLLCGPPGYGKTLIAKAVAN